MVRRGALILMVTIETAHLDLNVEKLDQITLAPAGKTAAILGKSVMVSRM